MPNNQPFCLIFAQSDERRVPKCQQSSAMLRGVHIPINPGSVFISAITVAGGGVAVTAIRGSDALGVKRDS